MTKDGVLGLGITAAFLAAFFVADRLLAAPGLARGAAQDGAGPDGDRGVPDPAERVVTPREVDEVLALVGADGTPAVEVPPLGRLPVPLGEPAGGGVEEGVAATAREVLACINAGDELRAAALFTDPGVRRFAGGAAELDALRAVLEAPAEPLPEEARLRLIAVTDVSLLPDRRAVAFVAINDPRTLPPGPQTSLIVFDRRGERWLIEEIIGFSQVAPRDTAGTPAATPAP